jgi:hypothetical protein
MSMSRSLNDGPQEAAINLVKNIKRDRDKSSTPSPKTRQESSSSTATTTTTSSSSGVKVKVEKSTSDDEQDEIKVYKDEGAAEEEQHSSENLNEDKIGLVNETEEVGF